MSDDTLIIYEEEIKKIDNLISKMLKGAEAKCALLVDKDGGSIRSLTGATITSRAIANSLQEQIAEVKKYLDSRQTEVQP